MDDTTMASLIDEGKPSPGPDYWDEIRQRLAAVDEESTATGQQAPAFAAKNLDTNVRRSELSVMNYILEVLRDLTQPRLGPRLKAVAAMIAAAIGLGSLVALSLDRPTTLEIEAAREGDSSDYGADSSESAEGFDDCAEESDGSGDGIVESAETPVSPPGPDSWYTDPDLDEYYACLDRDLVEDWFPKGGQSESEAWEIERVAAACIAYVPAGVIAAWEAEDLFDYTIFTDCIDRELNPFDFDVLSDEEIDVAHQDAKDVCRPLLPQSVHDMDLGHDANFYCLRMAEDNGCPLSFCAHFGVRW